MGVRRLNDFIQMCTSALYARDERWAVLIRVIIINFNSRLFAGHMMAYSLSRLHIASCHCSVLNDNP